MGTPNYAHVDEVNSRAETLHRVTHNMNAAQESTAEWLRGTLAQDRQRDGIDRAAERDLANLVTQNANKGWSLG